MSTPLYRTLTARSTYGMEYKNYADSLIKIDGRHAVKAILGMKAENANYNLEILEIRDYALLNMGVKLAEKRKFDTALEVLTSVRNFEKMAKSFIEIADYATNQEQREKIVQAAKMTLNQCSRIMTIGEMKKLPALLESTLQYLTSKAETIV